MSEGFAPFGTEEGYHVDDDGIDPGSGIDLFNRRSFHQMHRRSVRRGRYFVLRETRTQAAVAVAHFLEHDEGSWESPWRGSFGGFEVVEGAHLTIATLESFVASVTSQLARDGARQVGLVLAPFAYDAHEISTWTNVLLRQGFAITRHELSYAVEVSGSFEDVIDRGNRKQLRKAEREAASARRLDIADLEQAYAVIVENRAKKGRTPSMDWPSIASMRDRFPDAVSCFGVHLQGRMIASAICLRINPSVLYVFYWGEVAGVENLSPVTLLARTIYESCQENGIGLLDLGTSTWHGVPDLGLVRYKQNLGATASLKLWLGKVLP